MYIQKKKKSSKNKKNSAAVIYIDMINFLFLLELLQYLMTSFGKICYSSTYSKFDNTEKNF